MSSKNQRHCPALGAVISSVECGMRRGPALGCPGDCGFNPWNIANFVELLGPIEEAVFALGRQLVIKKCGEAEKSRLAHALEIHPLAFQAAMLGLLHHSESGGMTLVCRMLRDAGSGLRNDHRVMLGLMDQVQASLMEVRRVVDAHTIEVAELLDGGSGTFLVVDRAIARTVSETQVFFGFAYPTPYYNRSLGDRIAVMPVAGKSPLEVVTDQAYRLGWDGQASLRQWLFANGVRFVEALLSVVADLPGEDDSLEQAGTCDFPSGFADLPPHPLQMALSWDEVDRRSQMFAGAKTGPDKLAPVFEMRWPGFLENLADFFTSPLEQNHGMPYLLSHVLLLEAVLYAGAPIDAKGWEPARLNHAFAVHLSALEDGYVRSRQIEDGEKHPVDEILVRHPQAELARWVVMLAAELGERYAPEMDAATATRAVAALLAALWEFSYFPPDAKPGMP